jgi:hypothetical protein
MSETSESKIGRNWKTPSHEDWQYRNEAVIWLDGNATLPNLRPIAANLRAWLLREGQLQFLVHSDRTHQLAPTNPYTYNASVLALMYSTIINEASFFAKNREPLDFVDVEIKYLRLASELTLQTARLCEALIKQLLYCTDFKEDQYQNAALGALLSGRCRGCQKSSKKHYVSLLGSLAHRFGFCRAYEDCLHDKMMITNTTRNETAAHAGVLEFHGRSLEESRKLMTEHLEAIGNELIHMLNHILDIERNIISELEIDIRFHRQATFEVGFPIVSAGDTIY